MVCLSVVHSLVGRWQSEEGELMMPGNMQIFLRFAMLAFWSLTSFFLDSHVHS
jgi:hypothetical protein